MNKISIKEAGRYANFLGTKIHELSNIPYNSINSKLEKITEIHKKSNANSDAEDETIVIESDDKYDVTPEKVMEALEDIIEEKASLAMAISNAKANNLVIIEDKKIDIDSAIEYSKLLRTMSSDFFYPLLNRKDKTSKERATAYAFNIEGNQVPYVYEVEKKTELQYEKATFIKKQKELLLLADTASVAVDKVMNSDIVEFEPRYNYLDSVEDILTSK